MKKITFSIVLITLSLLIGCDSTKTRGLPTFSKPHADVIMLDGPTFEDDGYFFYYKGHVKNIGEEPAALANVSIYLYKNDGAELASEMAYVDNIKLEPGASSAWTVKFADDTHSIRDQLDKSRTQYKINWIE
jgi:hypothetical protein